MTCGSRLRKNSENSAPSRGTARSLTKVFSIRPTLQRVTLRLRDIGGRRLRDIGCLRHFEVGYGRRDWACEVFHSPSPFRGSFSRDQRSASNLHDGGAIAALEQIVEVGSGYAVLLTKPADVIGYSCLCVHRLIHLRLKVDEMYPSAASV
jgi:hypothetical protein